MIHIPFWVSLYKAIRIWLSWIPFSKVDGLFPWVRQLFPTVVWNLFSERYKVWIERIETETRLWGKWEKTYWSWNSGTWKARVCRHKCHRKCHRVRWVGAVHAETFSWPCQNLYIRWKSITSTVTKIVDFWPIVIQFRYRTDYCENSVTTDSCRTKFQKWNIKWNA